MSCRSCWACGCCYHQWRHTRLLVSATPFPPSFLRSTSPGRCAYRGKTHFELPLVLGVWLLLSPGLVTQGCWYRQPPSLLRSSGVLPPDAALTGGRPTLGGHPFLTVLCCYHQWRHTRLLVSATPFPPSFLRSTSPGRCAYRGKTHFELPLVLGVWLLLSPVGASPVSRSSSW